MPKATHILRDTSDPGYYWEIDEKFPTLARRVREAPYFANSWFDHEFDIIFNKPDGPEWVIESAIVNLENE